MSDLETQEVVEEKVEDVQETPSEETPEESEETHDIVARAVKKEAEKEEAKKEELPAEKEEDKAEEVKEVKPAHNPFSAWKKEAQEVLNKLDPVAQKYIIEREGQFHKGIEQYKEEANYAKSVKKAFSPHTEYLQKLGVTPEFTISHLVNAERQLRTGTPEQKAAMFHQMALDYGVDLAEISQVPFDPELFKLNLQKQRLQNQVQELQGSQQSAEDEQLTAHIAAFAETHEHYEELRQDMGLLLQEGRAASLEDAYAKAMRLHDGLFEKDQANRFEELKRQEALKANQAAKAAKAAAVSVKGAPVGGSNFGTPATTEDAVRQAMRRHAH